MDIRWLCLVLAAFILPACIGRDDDWDRSTMGWYLKVRDDNGSFASGRLTVDQVDAYLDARIWEWVQGDGRRLSYARAAKFILVDDWRFYAPDSPTGYAVGAQQGTGIMLAIWNRMGPSDTEPDAWLKRLSSTGQWYWAALIQGQEIPATAHELDHLIGIHND